jgi:hypothetical protein
VNFFSLSKPATTTKRSFIIFLIYFLFFLFFFCVRSDASQRPRGQQRGGEGDASARTWASAQTHTSVSADMGASARTRFLLRRQTVKTRPRVEPHPRGKRGRGRTSRRKGRPDGNFPPKSSFMTSLVCTGDPLSMADMAALN